MSTDTVQHPVTLPEALAVLGLPAAFTADELKQAYRSRMKEAHPDRGGSHHDALRVNAAKSLIERLHTLRSRAQALVTNYESKRPTASETAARSYLRELIESGDTTFSTWQCLMCDRAVIRRAVRHAREAYGWPVRRGPNRKPLDECVNANANPMPTRVSYDPKPLPIGTADRKPGVSYDPKPSPTGTSGPKSGSPTETQYAAFAACFAHFNVELFEGALPAAMLTFSRKAKTLGFFAPDRWTHADAKTTTTIPEIALNPDHLKNRDERAVASTIVHEMVHLWQHAFGASSRRGYHNAEWGTKMESIGLMPSSTGAPGGKRTGQRMTHYVIGGGLFDLAYKKLTAGTLLPFVSGSPEPTPGVKKARDPSKTKYNCSVCGLNAWAKPQAGLQHCDEIMVVVA